MTTAAGKPRINVLLIDDSQVVRMGLSALLARRKRGSTSR